MKFRVLHIPFRYIPEKLGGTEIYVASLCGALTTIGHECAIATPAQIAGVRKRFEGGVALFEFGMDVADKFEYAYGYADQVAAANLCTVLECWKPDILHLHAFSAAVSLEIVKLAKQKGIRVVFTYHTPTVSCMRGTMMHMGKAPCDGRMHAVRCTTCVLQKHGVRPISAGLLARMPAFFGRALGRKQLQGGVWTAMRMSSLIRESHRRCCTLFDQVDQVVAVCAWVADVLRKNGVEEARLTLSRQGLPYPFDKKFAQPTETGQHSLRIRYFGRLDPTKGVHVLIEALARIRDIKLTLEIFAVVQEDDNSYQKLIYQAAHRDDRISICPPLNPEEVEDAMSKCDLVAVPSQLLETGPLVVLEAFAAGTPVIGSRLGGIAELVRDGVDGFLVEPEDVGGWALAIAELAKDTTRLQAIREGIVPPRTTTQVAKEMHRLYKGLM